MDVFWSTFRAVIPSSAKLQIGPTACKLSESRRYITSASMIRSLDMPRLLGSPTDTLAVGAS
jgi:hypothetical protein